MPRKQISTKKQYEEDYFVFDCNNCNYSCFSKKESTFYLIARLHKKKCKKTGRTEIRTSNEEQKKWKKLNEKETMKLNETTNYVVD